MRTVEEVLTEYFSLISRDHHKDKDCHFSISKDYSYGEIKGYAIKHEGYCNRIGRWGWSNYYGSYKEAEEALILIVEEWIEAEKADQLLDGEFLCLTTQGISHADTRRSRDTGSSIQTACRVR